MKIIEYPVKSIKAYVPVLDKIYLVKDNTGACNETNGNNELENHQNLTDKSITRSGISCSLEHFDRFKG